MDHENDEKILLDCCQVSMTYIFLQQYAGAYQYYGGNVEIENKTSITKYEILYV